MAWWLRPTAGATGGIMQSHTGRLRSRARRKRRRIFFDLRFRGAGGPLLPGGAFHLYPASVTTLVRAAGEVRRGSYLTLAWRVARLTVANSTPGAAVRARSTRATQAAQCMPPTERVISSVRAEIVLISSGAGQ